MRVAHLTPLFAVIAATVLCSAAPPPGTENCLRGPFHGITATDETGAVVGHADAKDWGCIEGALSAFRGAGVPVPPPPGLCLAPAYPNPMTFSTRLTYTLPRTAHVNLTVWARSTGHGPPQVAAVKTIVDGDFPAGVHQVLWDGTDGQGARLPADVYRVVLAVEGRAVCGDVEVRP